MQHASQMEEQIDPAPWKEAKSTADILQYDDLDLGSYAENDNGLSPLCADPAVIGNSPAPKESFKADVMGIQPILEEPAETQDTDGPNPVGDGTNSQNSGVVKGERHSQTSEKVQGTGTSRSHISFKQGVRKVMTAKNAGLKVAMDNKIGTKLEGWSREVAFLLQQGIAAEGRGQKLENFQAPQNELFSRCRTACGIPAARYFAIMGLQDGLTEPNLNLVGSSAASGKSGAFFFLSPDQQLMAKSCTAEDWDTLLKILPDYTEYLEAARSKADLKANSRYEGDGKIRGFTETLLPRFLGLYMLTLDDEKDAKPKKDAKPIRVLVMANIFGGSVSIDRKYDMKGSTHGRKASKKELAKRQPVFKDLDWVRTENALGMTGSQRNALIESIDLDLRFLAEHGLMDYSLLVGVHDMSEDQASPYEAMNVITVRDSTRHCYVGIIDVLTPYGMRKRAETCLCGKVFCGRDISCQHPDVYGRRFKNFVDQRVFAASS
jgi:1-phosphatidylinositol-4-phosphate 5-kinase